MKPNLVLYKVIKNNDQEFSIVNYLSQKPDHRPKIYGAAENYFLEQFVESRDLDVLAIYHNETMMQNACKALASLHHDKQLITMAKKECWLIEVTFHLEKRVDAI